MIHKIVRNDPGYALRSSYRLPFPVLIMIAATTAHLNRFHSNASCYPTQLNSMAKITGNQHLVAYELFRNLGRRDDKTHAMLKIARLLVSLCANPPRYKVAIQASRI